MIVLDGHDEAIRVRRNKPIGVTEYSPRGSVHFVTAAPDGVVSHWMDKRMNARKLADIMKKDLEKKVPESSFKAYVQALTAPVKDGLPPPKISLTLGGAITPRSLLGRKLLISGA